MANIRLIPLDHVTIVILMLFKIELNFQKTLIRALVSTLGGGDTWTISLVKIKY